MNSKITYKKESFELIDELIDIGYIAEDIDVLGLEQQALPISKKNPHRTIQIFISFPCFEAFKDEIIALDEFINTAKIEILTYIIFNAPLKLDYSFKKLIPVFDVNDEFGSMYGTKIVSGSLKNKLTKALFLIGKDGAIYHIDMPTHLENPFNIERIRFELNKVYQSYTGVGCHG